jgi:hypothetical protein
MRTGKTLSLFRDFQEKLLNTKGNIAILCVNQNFMYWARRFVRETLENPLRSNNKTRYEYKNKTIYFVNTGLDDPEYYLRGLNNIKYLRCDGNLTDAYFEISEEERDHVSKTLEELLFRGDAIEKDLEGGSYAS